MLPSYYTNEILNAILLYPNGGVELYNALKSIHFMAYGNGDSVKYPQHKTLKITINPNSPEPIPLSLNTDFNYCKFEVTNTAAETTLFSLGEATNNSVSIEKSQLRKNEKVYGSNHELNDKPKLLIVEDNSPWTVRTGYSDPVKRRDIFFVMDNQIQNDPIATYNNNYSLPTCNYVDVSTEQKTFKNIVFERTSDSTYVTNLLSVREQYNVLIESVSILTPDQGEPASGVTPIHNDKCININDSAKIELRNITIDYTYSSINYYGYGIRLLNVWDCKISHLTAHNPRKGVMGNENLNGLKVEDSVLNRVDVHCYGRDIICANCTFKNTSNNYHIYNRVSSFYGRLVFVDCLFDEFLPLRIDSEYNAFTPFDLILDNCTLNVSSSHKSIVNTPILGPTNTTRPELAEKCLPNIIIKNLQLHFLRQTDTEFYFLRIYEYGYSGSIHYMNTFVVDVNEITQAAINPVTIYDFCYTDQVHVNTPLNLVEPLRQNINMIRHIVGNS